MQLKKFCRKGCQLYAAHILEATQNETPRLEDFHVLQEFRDVLPKEVLGCYHIYHSRDTIFYFSNCSTLFSQFPYI